MQGNLGKAGAGGRDVNICIHFKTLLASLECKRCCWCVHVTASSRGKFQGGVPQGTDYEQQHPKFNSGWETLLHVPVSPLPYFLLSFNCF